MKTMKNFILLLAATLSFISCQKDEDKIYLSSIESGELIATESNVVLLNEKSKDFVLSFAWTKDVLQISDPNLSPIDVISQSLQASMTEDFSGLVTESDETSLSRTYTGAALNTMVKTIGAISDEANKIYFRLASKTGDNMTPVYSNTVMVSVTPYTVDMSLGYVLNADQEDTGLMLYSPTSNGIYTGFMGVAGWYNYFLEEGNGTIWGNDAVDGSAFLMSSEDDPDKRWNFWFPGVAGCYYVEVNTTKKLWSALLVPTLTVSGDIEAEMTFDRNSAKWTTVFNAASATTLKVKLQGTGKQYNYTTGTDEDKGVDTAVAFAQSGDNLSFASQAGEISLTVPDAGEYTLVVDLKNPTAWTCSVTTGSTEPVEVNPHLYLPGIDDNISGGWNFNNYLTIYNEDDLAYAGVANVDSQYGYGFYTQKDNWEDKYVLSEGTAEAGTLVFKGDTNIPAPAAGLYLIETSIKNLTYALTAIGSQIYVSGLNDEWNFDVPLTATSVAGVFAGPVTINSASPWGFSIYVKNDDWAHKYGGSAGQLHYLGDNIKDDASLTPGTYQMTVDLIKGTYNITQ